MITSRATTRDPYLAIRHIHSALITRPTHSSKIRLRWLSVRLRAIYSVGYGWFFLVSSPEFKENELFVQAFTILRYSMISLGVFKVRYIKPIIAVACLNLLFLASSAYSIVVKNKTGTELRKIAVVWKYWPHYCYTKHDLKDGGQFSYRPGGVCAWAKEFNILNVDRMFYFCGGKKIGDHHIVTLTGDSKDAKCTIE